MGTANFIFEIFSIVTCGALSPLYLCLGHQLDFTCFGTNKSFQVSTFLFGFRQQLHGGAKWDWIFEDDHLVLQSFTGCPESQNLRQSRWLFWLHFFRFLNWLFWVDDSWSRIKLMIKEKSSLAILDNDHQDKPRNQNQGFEHLQSHAE